jgi:hypothetical protein
MKCSLLFSLLLTVSIALNGQIQLPYTASFDNLAEQNSWKQYKLGQETGLSYWEFLLIDQSVPDSFSLSHNYPVGGTKTTDNWIVSPELDMTKGAIIDSLFHLMNSLGGVTPQAADTIALYYLEGNRDPSLATKKEIVYDFLRTDFKVDNTWYSKSALKIPYMAKSGYLAFRYKTIVNWLDIKLDNIQVSPEIKSTVQRINNNIAVAIYPNPTSGVIKFRTDLSGDFEVSILDFSGKLIVKETVNTDSELHIEYLSKGVYFVEVLIQNQVQKSKFILE